MRNQKLLCEHYWLVHAPEGKIIMQTQITKPTLQVNS